LSLYTNLNLFDTQKYFDDLWSDHKDGYLHGFLKTDIRKCGKTLLCVQASAEALTLVNKRNGKANIGIGRHVQNSRHWLQQALRVI
jgi:hypothetical protein